MSMYDIILKKRNGGKLTKDEIQYFIEAYTDGRIPDYQASALLMAIYFNGMDEEETLNLTMSMAHSGEMADLSPIQGKKIDKHSTGGVGDKTTLIVAPLAAACGVKVAKMSGRGLGHTGGTIDKLESIPGLHTALSKQAFFDIVNQEGLCVIGQSMNLAPADKKLYALRDVTGTVDQISLIASSIMSKKLASGSDCILLDVKCGSGAFMKTEEDAIALAEEMVKIGENAGKQTVALITNMDIPLGTGIGNTLEVIEAIEILNGHGDENLKELCLTLSAYMLMLADQGDFDACLHKVKQALTDKSALNKLARMVAAQGGDASYIFHPEQFKQADYSYSVKAPCDGYIVRFQTEMCGTASVLLGAGRMKKEDAIHHSAGILIKKQYGAFVRKGDEIAVLFSDDESALLPAEETYLRAVEISSQKPPKEKIILAAVSRSGIKTFE